MISSSSLTFDFVEQGRLVFLRLQGALDEGSRLEERTPAFVERKLVVNLEGITRVTAPGVRDWVRWVHAQEARENSLHLMRCSPSVMGPLRRIRNFCGEKGHLVSFRAPYFCPPCKSEHVETLLTSMLSLETAAPISICHGCSEPMDFDEPLETYLPTLLRHAQRPVDPDVLAAIQRFGDGNLATAVATLQEISAGRLSSPSRYLTPTSEE
ncbi:MAG: hypothetical protein M3Y59_00610 [Myxococcota bacterium]|nr:hypothetical protein [Myxococcota bacterium]